MVPTNSWSDYRRELPIVVEPQRAGGGQHQLLWDD
jgi:hypothetical protein